MKIHQLILISTLATSLLLLAGCTTQTTTNTNAVTDTNTTNDNTNVVAANSNENTNAILVNENTNTEQGNEVDTSDWLTYSNEDYGFSFKYPEDWTITEKGSSVNVYSSGRSAELEVDPTTLADLYISIDETSTGSIKKIYSDKANYRLVQDDEDGVIVVYDQTNEFADSVNTYYYIQSTDENKAISATFFQNSLQADMAISIIQTINLYSEQTSEVETSDWLTYTNEDYGFSLKYPNTVNVDESYILTSNLNTTNTYSLIQLSLQFKYPSPVFSVNVALNNINTTVDQIMAPDIASSTSKSDINLAGKDLTAINVVGPEGSKVVYAYEIDSKTILISVPDNSEYAQILNTIQFTE